MVTAERVPAEMVPATLAHVGVRWRRAKCESGSPDWALGLADKSWWRWVPPSPSPVRRPRGRCPQSSRLSRSP